VTTVLIDQFAPNLDGLSPTDGDWDALLNRAASGFALPGATSTAATLDDPYGSSFDVFVAGTNLSYDQSGQLSGGTITSISMLSPQGTILASLSNALPGGIAIDVAALRAASGSPDMLDALVAHWDITYSAKFTPGGAGVVFEGARGLDSIHGTAAADSLSGASGNDNLWGDGGNDWLWGDHTQHLLSDAPSGNDRLDAGAGNDWLLGGAGDDRLYAGDGADTLRGDDPGQAGSDIMDGGAGADAFFSEGGDDTYVGGTGRDRIDFGDDPTGGLVTLDLSILYSTGFGRDNVSGIEIIAGSYEGRNQFLGSKAAESMSGGWHEDSLRGAGGNDRLWGEWGNDTLQGDAGNDLLGGDQGLDTLWGGAGRDQFYFTDAAGDRVEDFAAADDQIWIAKGMGGLSRLGLLDASAFKDLSLGKVDSSDRVTYDRAAGKLWLDADGSGAGARTLLAQLDPGTALSAADIEVKPVWDRDDFLV